MSEDNFDPHDGDCPGSPDHPGGDMMRQLIQGMARAQMSQALGVALALGNKLHQEFQDPIAGLIAETIHNLFAVVHKTTEQVQGMTQEELEAKKDELIAEKWHQMIAKFIDENGGAIVQKEDGTVVDERQHKEMPSDVDRLIQAAMQAQLEEKDEEKPN